MRGGQRFSKYEGLGNDFLVLEGEAEGDVTPEQARRLCDRRLGVGADGVLLLLPAREAGSDRRMRVLNADGSIPEMCGNGVRCVALALARGRGQASVTLRIETDAGLRECRVDDAAGQGQVTVQMGAVQVLGPRELEMDGVRIAVTVADAGNPHAVLFGPFTRGDVERLGPRLATHPAFPRGTNVEFAQVAQGGAAGIDLVVWERGVGITLACGTGACATVAVARAAGLIADGAPTLVRLPGGTLTVSVDAAGGATMAGPARHVFDGLLAQGAVSA